MRTHYVTLDVTRNKCYNELSDLEKKLLILKIDKKEELEKSMEKDEELMAVGKRIKDLIEDSKFVGVYDLERRQEWENKMKISSALDEGKELGLAEGKELGFLKGQESGKFNRIVENQINTALKLINKGYDISEIEEITELPIKKIKKLLPLKTKSLVLS